MEPKYPTLKRPKRKLCYLTNKESSSKKWTEPLTLDDIDTIFDDLDVHDDLLPPPTLLQTFDIEPNRCERVVSPVPQEGHRIETFLRCQMGPKVDALRPVTSSSPKRDIDLDIPFKAHMPVKTSSPIEVNVVVEELNSEKDRVVSPILFADEDEGKEEAKAEPLLIQEPRCNEHGTEENDDSELESPPSKVVFSKPKMSSHQNKVAESCKGSPPVTEKKIQKKPQKPDLEGKNKKPREENTEPPVSAARQEPELAKISENVHSQPLVESTSVGKDMTAFLKKLRDAGQSKPPCSRKSLTPVKVPTPAEPEDDFLILEDENLLWFSIPSKTATSKKQRQGRTSSTDKDSSTDKGKKDSPLKTAQKPQESDQTKNKLGSQTVTQKTKKKKGGEKKIKEAEPGNYMDELSTPEDLPAGDLVEEKPNKKKQRLRKVTSKESDEEEEQPKDGASGETYEEKTTQKTEKKAQQPSDMKRPTSLKDGNENAKTSRAKSLKGARKATRGSDAVKQTMKDEAEKEQSQSSEEHADAEALGSLPDEEIMNSEPQTKKDVADKKHKRNKIPVVSQGSSSEDGQILGKRKRKLPGQWWLDQRDSEETTFTDQHTLKKSKQPNKEPSAAVPPPVKTKKDRALKKINQTPPAPSSSQNINKAKGKKTKRNKNKNTGEDRRPDEVFQGVEAEQFEEQLQQEVVDQDQSSPFVHSHRDHSSNSGDQVFQRVYHHASTKKLSTLLAPVSPRGPRDQLRAAEPKTRRRKPSGSWWKVDDECENVESISPQQQGPKPRKERKMVSKRSRSPRLGTPKNGNMAVSSKPQGGAPVCRLELKPTSAPKTVKRSLATFKDLFTSVTETAAVVNRREPCQKNKRKVAARPAEEVPATVCTIFSERTDGGVLSMDAVEPGSPHNSPPNHETPQNSNRLSENRLELLRSGPSSMIDLNEYEEDDNSLIRMPPSSHAALSVSDLCAPPLKPLVLQLKDKTNLTEWFRSLWSVPANKGPEVTPDQFDWYFYQGRAIGFLVDLDCGSFCNGRMLLGSYMKKPLWVDHSATTVFNLLTSSVSVTIDGKESCFNPGQSFMVECGHAYNIQNITAQPAVLYFTRMFAESSD